MKVAITHLVVTKFKRSLVYGTYHWYGLELRKPQVSLAELSSIHLLDYSLIHQ